MSLMCTHIAMNGDVDATTAETVESYSCEANVYKTQITFPILSSLNLRYGNPYWILVGDHIANAKCVFLFDDETRFEL